MPDHRPRAKRDGGTPRQSPGGGLVAPFPAPLCARPRRTGARPRGASRRSDTAPRP
ncbi:hypothetical protein SBRY_21012 [Actinacidiphila bryophytorum]|uniref:Uncharacterized protein n=1 Tax=Actinacidiphila bryophytorum TaxID=1436133 RepID=A0A9W4E5M8_9ACTN|nr:hypothetical protein SBRY_21012 [Actinacidiphila bryophytorum]